MRRASPHTKGSATGAGAGTVTITATTETFPGSGVFVTGTTQVVVE
jgi:hypothetical protein